MAKAGQKPKLPNSRVNRGNKKPKLQGRHKNSHVLQPTFDAPQYSAEELSVKKLDKRMVGRYISLNFALSKNELEEKLRKPISIFERGIIQIMLKTAEKADQYRMDFLLDRLIGKVKSEVDLSVTKTEFDTMSDEELLAEKRRLDEINLPRLKYFEKQLGIIDVTPKATNESDDD